MSALELDDATYTRIRALSDEGEERLRCDDSAGALERFRAALALVPEPKTDWEAATWLWAAIGDVLFLDGEYPAARDAFVNAIASPGGFGNPFVHLRFGQASFECGDLERAAEELVRAFALEGNVVFEGEDPKYVAFLGTRARLT